MSTSAPTYVLCTAFPIGGTLLAYGLAATGLGGVPAEYFDTTPANENYWRDYLKAKCDRNYLDRPAEQNRLSNDKSEAAGSGSNAGYIAVDQTWADVDALRGQTLASDLLTIAEARIMTGLY
jgi:LPS sulfotransferase NodH